MNVDEILDRAGLPKAEPDVEKAWATVVQRVERRRTRRRALVGGCALALIALAVGASALQQTSGDLDVAAETDNRRPQPGGAVREVEYLGARFDVPSSLPLSRPDEYEFRCLTYQADGVFLAPEDISIVGASCPAAFDEYGSTIHVQPLLVDGPGDRTVEGEGPDERWVNSTETNRWYEAALPHYGLLFTFYELDEAVREVVLSSVRPADDEGPLAPEDAGASSSTEDADSNGVPILSSLPSPVEPTVIFEDPSVILEASTSTNADAVLCVGIKHVGTPRSGSICGDPRSGDDVVLAAGSETLDSSRKDWVHWGFTRASAASVLATSTDGTEQAIDVHHHPRFPDFAFFYFNDLGPLESFVARDESGSVVAEASPRSLDYSHTEPAQIGADGLEEPHPTGR
jgi:hypothetical protein